MSEITLQKDLLKDAIRDAIQEALPQKEPQKATLTILECARYTGIGKDKLMELAHSTKTDFPAFKVGKKFLINRDLLDKWLVKISVEGRTL